MMDIATEIGLIVVISLTLMTWSQSLYKDNLLFSFAEYTFVGIATGYTTAMTWKAIVNNTINPIISGSYLYIVPLILGVLLFTRFSRSTMFISRWPMALLIGVGIALGTRSVIKPSIIDQILNTIALPAMEPKPVFNYLVILTMVITAIAYFIFTREHLGTWGRITRVGRASLMMYFGAIYAQTVMSRMTLLSGRITYIIAAIRAIAGI
jgi:hypothetical protein